MEGRCALQTEVEGRRALVVEVEELFSGRVVVAVVAEAPSVQALVHQMQGLVQSLVAAEWEVEHGSRKECFVERACYSWCFVKKSAFAILLERCQE